MSKRKSVELAFIRIKDKKLPDGKLIYQGPASYGCVSVTEEQLVDVWGSDPTSEHGGFELLLTVSQALDLAGEIIKMAGEVVQGNPAGGP